MHPKITTEKTFEKIAHTCTLTAKSCENTSIQFVLRGIPEDKAKRIFRIAKGAFRDVEIVSEITGEVLISEYVSSEWFNPACSYGDAIDDIIAIYEGK